MADGKIKISELEEALQLSDNAEFPYSQDNGGVPTTFKAPANQIARKVAEGSTFTNLTTTAKTLVGAINELSHLGNPIIIGTTAPTSSQGADGNIYIQYTAGTGGADDEVDGIFVKIDGAWCEIQTGGGSGTTDYEDLSNKPQVNSVELVGNKSLDDLGIMPASLSKTVSGSIAHFTDGADNIPVKSLVSEIVAVESGSGEKSPSNPYTINGFDSGVITVTDNDQITNTYTFTFGQTVYGGHFDNNGNLANNRGELVLSSLNWYYSSNGYFEASINIDCPTVTQWVAQNGNCGIYTIVGMRYVTNSADRVNNSIAWYSNVIRVADNSTTNVSIFVANLQNQYVYYELANPIVLPISSQDIPTLLGENNIFSNTGDVEVNYYIDNADEIVEVSKATASTLLHNYSTDEQVVGTWIDGSTLYEKTFDLSSVSLTNATWNSNVLGTSTSNIKIRKFSGTFNLSDGGAFVNEPYADYIYFRSTTDYFTAVINGDGNDLNLRPQINGVTMTAGVCTIQYTKSST